eukprot:Polyplicarium_translucidae@DN4785_c0_g1_i1.p1
MKKNNVTLSCLEGLLARLLSSDKGDRLLAERELEDHKSSPGVLATLARFACRTYEQSEQLFHIKFDADDECEDTVPRPAGKDAEARQCLAATLVKQLCRSSWSARTADERERTKQILLSSGVLL